MRVVHAAGLCLKVQKPGDNLLWNDHEDGRKQREGPLWKMKG